MSLRSATMLIALLTAGTLASRAVAGRIAYPGHPSIRLGGRGGPYVARLAPARNSEGRVGSLDLELRRAGTRGGGNLLAPARSWHGWQRFILFACDLRAGQSRALPVRGTRDILRVRVRSVRAGPGCALEALLLDVALVRRR